MTKSNPEFNAMVEKVLKLDGRELIIAFKELNLKYGLKGTDKWKDGHVFHKWYNKLDKEFIDRLLKAAADNIDIVKGEL